MVKGAMNRLEQNNKVIIWTLVLCFMVMIMVVIGGVTRLTGSGLSMVEWKPLMGAIPPLNLNDWNEVFAKYQTSPQYKLVNQGMSLSEFQWIYFWEYFHRLIGRLLGIVFFIPWVFFWIKNYISKKRAFKFLIGFLLGGLQGLMGWIMVASGLVDQPQVSHLRLAAHLVLAFFILAYFWRIIWELNLENNLKLKYEELENDTQNRINNYEKSKMQNISVPFHFLNKALNGMLFLLIVQIFYGALVAGLRAGFIANTFPDMQGSFFPLGGWVLSPSWINIIENPLTVQWVHRILGWSLFISAVVIYTKSRLDSISVSIQKVLLGLVAVIGLQFIIGIMTLLFRVPLPLAVLHQVGAAILLLYLLWVRWQIQTEAV